MGASCAGFGFCGEGQLLDETEMCAADSCTEMDDVDNCCIDLATCNSYFCDSSTEIPIPNADTTFCADATCEASDNCCEPKALCSTFDSCYICDAPVDGAYCAEASCTSSDYDTCCMEIISDLDDSKCVTLTLTVSLKGGDLDTDDLDAITDHVAYYLNLTCISVDASYTGHGSNWNVTFELSVCTDGNEDAGADLKAYLAERRSIDGLESHISINLGFDISMKTLSLSFSFSAKESGLSTGVIIAIVVAIVLLIAAIAFAVYKHKQPKSVGQKLKVVEVFEM